MNAEPIICCFRFRFGECDVLNLPTLRRRVMSRRHSEAPNMRRAPVFRSFLMVKMDTAIGRWRHRTRRLERNYEVDGVQGRGRRFQTRRHSAN